MLQKGNRIFLYTSWKEILGLAIGSQKVIELFPQILICPVLQAKEAVIFP